ncbi:hypothetical protein F4781DRAFT_429236 [Annulohypoxylon bovei var. microspora]|nr:hypothetical protein F4781DRAFT_429236 [Annulohypoxylon bovei var. microspora]
MEGSYFDDGLVAGDNGTAPPIDDKLGGSKNNDNMANEKIKRPVSPASSISSLCLTPSPRSAMGRQTDKDGQLPLRQSSLDDLSNDSSDLDSAEHLYEKLVTIKKKDGVNRLEYLQEIQPPADIGLPELEKRHADIVKSIGSPPFKWKPNAVAANPRNLPSIRNVLPEHFPTSMRQKFQPAQKSQSPPIKLLLQQQQQKKIQSGQAKLPGWKAKAAQKKNRRPGDDNLGSCAPMSPSGYVRFVTGSDTTYVKGIKQPSTQAQNASAAGKKPAGKKPAKAKSAQVDDAQVDDAQVDDTQVDDAQVDDALISEPTPVDLKTGSVVLPKITAQVETQMAETSIEENKETTQENGPEANDVASAHSSSSATMTAEEVINQSENIPWNELVAVAVALKSENDTLATEATPQKGTEGVEPSAMPLTENILSQADSAQAAHPSDVPLPDSPCQTDMKPPDEQCESALRNKEPIKEMKGTAETQPKALDSPSRRGEDSDTEDEDGVEKKTVAQAAKAKEKNAKKKERKKRKIALEWERRKKTEQSKQEWKKAEQAKQELKKAKRKEQQEQREAAQRNAQKVEEVDVPRQIQNDSEGEIEQLPLDQTFRDRVQTPPSEKQKTDTEVENPENFIEIKELDHHQRMENWVDDTSLHSGRFEETLQNELEVDMVPEEDNTKTNPWDHEKGGSECDVECDVEGEDRKRGRQVESLPEHHDASESKPTLPRQSREVTGEAEKNLELFESSAGDSKYPRIDTVAHLAFSPSTSTATSLIASSPETDKTLANTHIHDGFLPNNHNVPLQEPPSTSTPVSAISSNALQPQSAPPDCRIEPECQLRPEPQPQVQSQSQPIESQLCLVDQTSQVQAENRPSQPKAGSQRSESSQATSRPNHPTRGGRSTTKSQLLPKIPTSDSGKNNADRAPLSKTSSQSRKSDSRPQIPEAQPPQSQRRSGPVQNTGHGRGNRLNSESESWGPA